MIVKNKKIRSAQKHFEQTHVVESEDWYSDPGEEDELLCMSDSDDDAPRHPIFRGSESMKKFEMVELLKFADAKQYRQVLKDWSVRQGFELHYLKNEKTRVTAVCADERCTWRIHASPIMGGPAFQVKTIKGEHVCTRKNTNRLANSKYIAKRLEDVIRENPNITILMLQKAIKRKCSLEVGKWKAYKVKNLAMGNIREKDSQQYNKLWDYCETVRKNNPGSTLLLKKVELSNPPIFETMYFSLDAMKKGFLSGCRPFIGLDGSFLKTIHSGQLLVAVGRDSNDNMWPIAMEVVSIENRENWTWFVGKLLEEIGGEGGYWWTFISDRQKGLVEALRELVPGCEHRFCCRHMYENFKKKFKDPNLKDLFWRAASTANEMDFKSCMNEIEKLDPKIDPEKETASEWLKNIPPQHWCRAYFSTCSKVDTLVYNMCESFNSYILEARDQPIITMFEWIRERLMTRIQTKRSGMEKYIGTICPNIVKKIKKNQLLGRECNAMWSGQNEYEVHKNLETYVVDLDKRICTCGMFQLSGIPCAHATTAIGHRRGNDEDFVDDCFKKSTYMKAYENMIHPVPGQSHYITTGIEPLGPPKFLTKVGRPKKKRQRGPDEKKAKSTRKGLTHMCSNCLQQGHNKGSCRNPTHPQSRLHKPKKQKEQVASTSRKEKRTRKASQKGYAADTLSSRAKSVNGAVRSSHAHVECSKSTVQSALTMNAKEGAT